METLTGKLSAIGTIKGEINYLSSEVSPWTKIGETEITVSTTNTQAVLQTSIQLDDIWTDSDIIYIRIRDKAGKRVGYFLGTDTFFINYRAANGETGDDAYAGRFTHRYNGTYEQYSGNAYGVYPQSISSDGTIRIYSRYEVGYSRKINGTYKIEVFRLRYPDNISPFDI